MALIDKQHTKNNNWEVPTQMFYYQDVKEAVIELDDWLYNNRHKEVDYFTYQDIRKQLYKIMGDFTKENIKK